MTRSLYPTLIAYCLFVTACATNPATNQASEADVNNVQQVATDEAGFADEGASPEKIKRFPGSEYLAIDLKTTDRVQSIKSETNVAPNQTELMVGYVKDGKQMVLRLNPSGGEPGKGVLSLCIGPYGGMGPRCEYNAVLALPGDDARKLYQGLLNEADYQLKFNIDISKSINVAKGFWWRQGRKITRFDFQHSDRRLSFFVKFN